MDIVLKFKKWVSKQEGDYEDIFLTYALEYIFQTHQRFLEYVEETKQDDESLLKYINTLDAGSLEELKDLVKDIKLDGAEQLN